MNRCRLFKRNAQGKILSWECEVIGDHAIALKYGLLKGEQRIESYGGFARTAEKEFTSRVNAKRKDGYKTIGELRDNAPVFISDSDDMCRYLETYLPKENTMISGDKFCMLAKTLEDNKPFEKRTYNGQWKINGERCLIGANKTLDMFKPIQLTYMSRRGNDWTHLLNWMDDIIIPCLRDELIEMMVEEGVRLDGELYIPGYKINDINSIIKNPDTIEHKALQFWCYDIAIDNMSAEARYSSLVSLIPNKVVDFETLSEHLNNKRQLLVLPTEYVANFNDAYEYRNRYIDLGFEGLIIRDVNAEYQFGNRNLSMLKYKKIYDGFFEIVHIEPQKKKDNLPLFILKNDINSETFECTLNAPHYMQEAILKDKDKVVGLKAFVEYRERSGVKEVPFHAKMIYVNLPGNKPKETKQTVKRSKIKLKL